MYTVNLTESHKNHTASDEIRAFVLQKIINIHLPLSYDIYIYLFKYIHIYTTKSIYTVYTLQEELRYPLPFKALLGRWWFSRLRLKQLSGFPVMQPGKSPGHVREVLHVGVMAIDKMWNDYLLVGDLPSIFLVLFWWYGVYLFYLDFDSLLIIYLLIYLPCHLSISSAFNLSLAYPLHLV